MGRSRKCLCLLMLFSMLLSLALWQGWLQPAVFQLLLTLDRRLVQPMATALAPTVAHHPLGKPAAGELPWENQPEFQALCVEHAAQLRMAAYATTLPDPLPGEEYNVAKAAAILSGTVLLPGQVFSMNQVIGPYNMERGFKEGPIYIGDQVAKGVGGGVCKMATTLYNTAILANLPILARRNHSMLVPYANPGQDATVSDGAIDLKFKNDTDSPIVIWSETIGVTLYVAFYGKKAPPEVTWHHEILQVQERPLIRRPNPQLGVGQEQIIIPGAEGIVVKSWLTLQFPDGSSQQKNLGIDWYRPMPRVIEHGPPR